VAEIIIGNILSDRGIAVLGLIGTVIGLILAVYFYRKSLKAIGADYYIATNHLIGPLRSRYSELRIIYQQNEITSFSSSKAFLWNRGSEAIRSTDIAPSAPLVIDTEGSEVVLDHKVLYCSSTHSKVSTRSQGYRRILIDFDYLDPKEGIILEVLHTGGPASISLSGSVIGGGEIRRKEKPRGGSELALSLAMILVSTATFILMLAGILFMFHGYPTWFLLILSLGAWGIIMFATQKLSPPLWYGGFMVEKLSDGYAKQEKAGSPPVEGDPTPPQTSQATTRSTRARRSRHNP
jgi:hypothetical protein